MLQKTSEMKISHSVECQHFKNNDPQKLQNFISSEALDISAERKKSQSRRRMKSEPRARAAEHNLIKRRFESARAHREWMKGKKIPETRNTIRIGRDIIEKTRVRAAANCVARSGSIPFPRLHSANQATYSPPARSPGRLDRVTGLSARTHLTIRACSLRGKQQQQHSIGLDRIHSRGKNNSASVTAGRAAATMGRIFSLMNQRRVHSSANYTARARALSSRGPLDSCHFSKPRRAREEEPRSAIDMLTWRARARELFPEREAGAKR